MYPDRFDDKGVLQQSCTQSGATLWGAACDAVMTAYAATIANPAACKGDACTTGTVQCFAGNSATGSALSGDACELVDLLYGYQQW